MKQYLTPHVIVAAVIVLITLVIAIGPLTTGSGAQPLPVTDLKIPSGVDHAVVPASTARLPLSQAYAGPPEANPFTLRQKLIQKGPRIPFPPPPPLAAPGPPVLPLASEEHP